MLLFRHSPTFDATMKGLLTDDELRDIQLHLCIRPESGAVIRGTGGVRKLRWSRPGMGKSGGIRLWYVYQRERERIFLILAYAKNEQDDVTDAERNDIKALVERMKREP